MPHAFCRSVVAGLVGVMVVGATACRDGGGDGRGPGSSADSSAVAAAAPAAAERTTWLLVRPDIVMHLRWDVDGAELTGTARIGRRSADGTTVTTEALDLSGAANGRHVVLRADERPWSGTVVGNALILTVPRPDGSLEDLSLAPGTAEDYDAALREMRGPEPTATTTSTTTTTTTTPTTTTAAPPATPGPAATDDPAARRAELADRTARLVELQATDDVLAAADVALGELEAAADAVAGAGPTCASAGAAASAFARAAERATATIDEVEDRAAQLRRQSDAVLEAGRAVSAAGDPAANVDIRDANAQLISADAAASDLERYAGQVRAAITMITTRSGC